eukprot:5561236-Prymnesium_polylepis.2
MGSFQAPRPPYGDAGPAARPAFCSATTCASAVSARASAAAISSRLLASRASASSARFRAAAVSSLLVANCFRNSGMLNSMFSNGSARVFCARAVAWSTPMLSAENNLRTCWSSCKIFGSCLWAVQDDKRNRLSQSKCESVAAELKSARGVQVEAKRSSHVLV